MNENSDVNSSARSICNRIHTKCTFTRPGDDVLLVDIPKNPVLFTKSILLRLLEISREARS